MGRCNHLLKSFLWSAPQTIRAVSCIFTSWVSLGHTVGNGCSLMAARWQVFFPFLGALGVPQLTTGCVWAVVTMLNTIFKSIKLTKGRKGRSPRLIVHFSCVGVLIGHYSPILDLGLEVAWLKPARRLEMRNCSVWWPPAILEGLTR